MRLAALAVPDRQVRAIMATLKVACFGRLVVCCDHRGRFLALALDHTGEARAKGDDGLEVHFAGEPDLCAHHCCSRRATVGDRVCAPCRERRPNAYLPC